MTLVDTLVNNWQHWAWGLVTLIAYMQGSEGGFKAGFIQGKQHGSRETAKYFYNKQKV